MTPPPPPKPARTTPYGDDPAQVYDVRLPDPRRTEPGKAPRSHTVVVVHGGFWRSEWDREHAAPQAQAFADAGHHVAVLEYRRTGMPGGGWPGTFDDVKAALAAVHADPDLPGPLVLVGHSAGGHLVALAAAQPWAPDRLAGVVPLAGVVDLDLAHRLRLGSGAVAAFLGPRAAELQDADPARHHPLVPVALVHGTDDDVVPLSVSESYLRSTADPDPADSAELAAPVSLDAVPGAGHMDLVDPHLPAFARTLAAVERLAPN